MAEPSSLSGTTRGQYLQGKEEENPGCLVSSAAHIQLWGCCPSPLLPGGCRDKSKGKAKTSGHPGSRLSGELVQRAGLAQKTCNWPSWAITCCKRRQRDSFDTTVKITLLEKKKSIQTPQKENQKPRPSIPEIKSWKSQWEDSQICTEKQNFTYFADKLLFMLKDKGAMRMQASMYSWKSNPWQKIEQAKILMEAFALLLSLPHL